MLSLFFIGDCLGGYLFVDDILRLRSFSSQRTTLRQIEKIVNSDSKGRFELDRNSPSGQVRIRAVQGHSLRVRFHLLTVLLSVLDS